MEPGWFEHEVAERTRHCDFEPLVTTATDGDNGGWFRNVTEGANFWSAFYRPLLERARAGGAVAPIFIEDYLDRYGAWGEVRVETGAWNTGWHHGSGFTQWTGSAAQRDALARIADLSARAHGLRWAVGERCGHDPGLHRLAEEALWRILRAETSCNVYWGEAWVPRVHADLDEAEGRLAELAGRIQA